MELLSWLALVAQDPETALAALPQIPEANAPDADGLTALHVAILWGHEALALALLDAGSDPKAAARAKTKAWVNNLSGRGNIYRPDGGWFHRPKTSALLPVGGAFDKGGTPLHAAAAVGSTALIQALLARKARAVKDGVGATPLHLAAVGGHVQAARLLLNAKSACASGTKVRKSLRFYDVGVTPLMAALEAGQWGLAQEMLALGADPLARTKFGCSAVFFAARGGSLAALEASIALGIDPKETGDSGNFPMVEATRNGHYDVVARLLALGANTVQPSGMHAPLLKAFELGDRRMVQVLIDGGAGPLPDHGPGFFAGVNDWVSLGNYLENGGDPNVLRRGDTPLMSAASSGHVEVTELLLAHG
ncbi:MAG: ankyrin repeat protein, partial [Cognaticolwellia sp.]